MDFVSSAANLRMFIFSMSMKSRFDVKCEYLCIIVSLVNFKLDANKHPHGSFKSTVLFSHDFVISTLMFC